jgi:hypothetical protein
MILRRVTTGFAEESSSAADEPARHIVQAADPPPALGFDVCPAQRGWTLRLTPWRTTECECFTT